MTIRRKTILFVGLSLALIIWLLYSTSAYILLHGFANMEQDSACRDIKRALHAYQQKLDAFIPFLVDWAHWDDTYEFIVDGNKDYIESNLTSAGMFAHGFNLIAYMNATGHIVFASGFDLVHKQALSFPTNVLPILNHPRLQLNSETNQPFTGLVLLPESFLIIAASPILTSEDKGPSRGTFLVGIDLDPRQIERDAELPEDCVRIIRLDTPTPNADVQSLCSQLKNGDPIRVRLDGDQYVSGYALLNDIDGQTAALMEVKQPRAVYRQGLHNARYLIAAFVVIGIVLCVFPLGLLEHIILSRLSHLSSEVDRIGVNVEQRQQVTVAGHDELSFLANSINRMLNSIWEYHSALRESEQNLRISNQTLSTLIQSSPLAIVTLDANLTVKTWNSTAEAMFGWKAEDVIGKLSPLLTETRKDDIRTLHQLALQGNGFRGIEIRRPRKDGAILDLRISMALVQSEREQSREVIEVIEDVTDHKRSEGEKAKLENLLIHAQKMEAIGRLASGIIHDFNNLIQVISGNLSLVMREIPPDHPVYSMLSDMDHAADDAGSLTRQLLMFTRKKTLKLSPVNVNALISGMQSMVNSMLGKQVQIQLTLQDNLKTILGDPTQLEQILINLLVNAKDAGATRIRIETIHADVDERIRQHHPQFQPGEQVKLTVADNGSGMDENTLKHVFEPFFTTKPPGKGTGLGLTTIWTIIQKHGGLIEVQSEAGSGTAFTIHLPAYHVPSNTATGVS